MPKTPLKCVQTWFVEHVTPCVLAVTLKPKNTLRLLLLKKKKSCSVFMGNWLCRAINEQVLRGRVCLVHTLLHLLFFFFLMLTMVYFFYFLFIYLLVIVESSIIVLLFFIFKFDNFMWSLFYEQSLSPIYVLYFSCW